MNVHLKVINKTKNIFSHSYLKPIIQNSLCHKNVWPQLIDVKILKRENIKSKWRKMLSVTEVIYENTKKCMKLTSDYTQHKNNTPYLTKNEHYIFWRCQFAFLSIYLVWLLLPTSFWAQDFYCQIQKVFYKIKGRFFRSTICATNRTTWIRHLGEPLDHVQLSIFQCLCFCLPFSAHALIYRKICKHGRHL